MNGESFFRSTIGAMIAQGFAVDDVREKLFLKGASEVWGGEETDSHPAWYFWLTNRPGAYRLQLVDSGRLDELPTFVIRGVFSLKYYPSPSEPVFNYYSKLEQALILGETFDQTNTPKFETKVPDNLFNVGTFEFIRDLERKQSFLIYSSLDQFCFHTNSHEVNKLDDHQSKVLSGPSISRKIPAWDLGYPLFDTSVGLHAFLMREPPKRVVLSHQSGFEFLENITGYLIQRNSKSTTFKSLLVSFGPERCEGNADVEQFVTSLLLGSSGTSIYDSASQQFQTHNHPHGGNGRASDPNGDESATHVCGRRHRLGVQDSSCQRTIDGVAICEDQPVFNEQWWLMAEAKQIVKSMCGCH